MPCYRCGKRQADPDRGESPWHRGVRADRQVLICPDCQVDHDWMSDLDRCGVCTSVRLVRRLGEAECCDCGAVGQVARSSPFPDNGAADGVGADLAGADLLGADLAAEVERALAKVLRPGRQRPPYAMS